MDIVIFGNGAHGQDMADDFLNRGCRVAMLDDNPERSGGHPGPVTHIGVNDSRKRRELAQRLGVNGWQCGGPTPGPAGNWIHSDALYNRTIIGEHTHINAGAFLTRCRLGDFVTVGPNATICGDVTIGDDVMIGAGAVIKNLLTIGDGAVIGCGAIIVEDVPPGAVMISPKAVELHKARVAHDGPIRIHIQEAKSC